MQRLSPLFTLLALLATVAALPAAAHVTPNVQLVQRGAFVQKSLPAASKFFEKHLDLGSADLAAVRRATGWTPSQEDTKVYVGRDAGGALVGTVVFIWTPSQHGPVSVAVAFDPSGKVLRATVTDVGSEPLSWVQPLLDAGGMEALAGLAPDQKPDPAAIAPAVKGRMSRYYAEVIARGVERAQAIERVAAATPAS
jgi:hypothetical protein